MDNQTNDSLKIKYSFADSYFAQKAKDTLIYIKGHQKDTLFIYDLISTSVYNPEDQNKMIYVVNVDITRMRDNAKIVKDVTLKKNWNYIETGKYAALMQFTIIDNDFNQ
jgi:hypothetical protein